MGVFPSHSQSEEKSFLAQPESERERERRRGEWVNGTWNFPFAKKKNSRTHNSTLNSYAQFRVEECSMHFCSFVVIQSYPAACPSHQFITPEGFSLTLYFLFSLVFPPFESDFRSRKTSLLSHGLARIIFVNFFLLTLFFAQIRTLIWPIDLVKSTVERSIPIQLKTRNKVYPRRRARHTYIFGWKIQTKLAPDSLYYSQPWFFLSEKLQIFSFFSRA